MNFGQLRSAVYDLLGVDTNDGLLTPTVIGNLVNRANHTIESDAEWPWLQASETISIVANTDTYAPNVNWKQTIELVDDVERVLERYSITEMNDRWRSTTTGKPRDFAIFADQIVVRPVPDSAYTFKHRYYRFEPELVNDSDSPLSPNDMHGAIVEYAAYLALRRDRENARVQEAKLAYADWQKRMQIIKRRYLTPGRVRVRPGGLL